MNLQDEWRAYVETLLQEVVTRAREYLVKYITAA